MPELKIIRCATLPIFPVCCVNYLLSALIKNPNHSRAVGILKPQIGIIDIAAELRSFEPNLSNQIFILIWLFI